jgi:uncharacterized repeat protein (TIGR01451 family)
MGALLLAAFLAPAGQASTAGARSPGAEALAVTNTVETQAPTATRKAEREERTAKRKAEREERTAKRKAEREERTAASKAEREERAARRKARNEAEHQHVKEMRERKAQMEAAPKVTVRGRMVLTVSCTQVTWRFMNFRDQPDDVNTVQERLSVDGQKLAPVTFSFAGTSALQTVPIANYAPPGHYLIDAFTRWNSNGLNAGIDIPEGMKCGPAPAFSLEKLQLIEGGGGSYTQSPLSGHVGQTVDYEILVKNTGNVPLTLAGFTDGHCDSGTISEPSSGALAVGATATYHCKHLLSTADQSAGSYSNIASVTGTPPSGDGSLLTHSSNPVVVDVTGPSPASEEPHGEEHHEEPDHAKTTGTTSNASAPATSGAASSDPLSSPLTNAAGSGALAYKAASVPALKSPEGCVRTSFAVSVKSAGVQSVSFYLDGRKLKTLTARNAHRGLLTIEVSLAKLKVGAHKLLARITMTKTASTKATTASRTVTVLRCRPVLVKPKFTG